MKLKLISLELTVIMKILIKEDSTATMLKKFRAEVRSNDAAKKMKVISAKYAKDFL